MCICTISCRGICKCCGLQLKTFSLPEQRRITLAEKLQSIAESAISNANDSYAISHGPKLPLFTSTPDKDKRVKVQALKHYIESNGPFDIALDVLNAAYFRDRGFNSFQVYSSHFIIAFLYGWYHCIRTRPM